MGTSTSPQQLARKLDAAGVALIQANQTVVTKSALKVKRAAERERDRATGDGRLSNVGKRGSKLGVRYDLKPGASPSAVVRATGPWQIIEGDTKAHTIQSRRARRSAGRRAVLLTPFGYRRSVNHPGTKGKHPWRKAMGGATKDLKNEVAAPIRDALKVVFR